MRHLVVFLSLFAACGEQGRPAKAGAAAADRAALPVLRAVPVAKGTTIRVDGRISDPTWLGVKELVLPLAGGGVGEVKLKAAHDGRYLYMLVVWPDPTKSLQRYWEFIGPPNWWKKRTGEDGFSIFWAPGGQVSDLFAKQGCALFCHPGKPHVYPALERGFADAWYWGAQQTGFKGKARDLKLPFGAKQRLRGDRQPDDSDNIFNQNQYYEGPWGVPKRVGASRNPMYLTRSNTQPLPRARLAKLDVERNLGWKIPLDIQQPLLGSRGDVSARALYQAKAKAWVIEIARRLDTGNPDDLILGDPLVPVRFALAVHDASEGDAHSRSGPIELRFLPIR